MKWFRFTPDEAPDCTVSAWLQPGIDMEITENTRYPAVIICPGGGYRYLCAQEAEPVAKPFLAAGYHTFILYYSVGEEAKGFRPLCQLAETILQIRKKSAEWLVDPRKIAVCGFSAGGHLAASAGTLFNEEKFLKVYGEKADIRPNAMILGYPVITADEFAHVSSIEHVSGARAGSAEYQWFGLDKRVDGLTPPAFIWHTAADTNVPAENSLRFASALSRFKVPFELHIMPEGEHGMSVCTCETGRKSDYNGRWVAWSIQWLNHQFHYQL